MGRIQALFFFSVLLCSVSFVVCSESDDAEITTQTFIVRVQNDLKPSAFSDVEQWYKSTLRSLTSNSPLNSENQTPQKAQDFLHVYKTVFHGFSATLTQKQAQQLEKQPGVLSVLPDRVRKLQTTRSPLFMGLSSVNPTNIVTESDSGSSVIIGILDTGIWPERRSFHDEGLGPIPSGWKGECVEGEQFTKANCNKKIIGARYFHAGYEARKGPVNSSEEIKSARDSAGHGTHTASTAAGRAVTNASLFGYASGNAMGVAPKARIAVYKICWKDNCMDSDILAAFDKAVEDGVNIISISVGGGSVPYNLDPLAIGAFGAMERGILVSASAGNYGPTKMSVTNVSPWVITVGASTIDREFPADLVLGDGRVIKGSSVYSGVGLPGQASIPLIYGGNASSSMLIGGRRSGSFSAATCQEGSLDPNAVRGKIVLCDRGGNSGRAAKGDIVRRAGGVGVAVANVAPVGEGLVADSHVIPGLSISESAGRTVREYINSSPNPTATIVFRGTKVGVKPAPVVAAFSSRGPNVESAYVLKPDIIAPGVNILAAWPGGVAPNDLPSDTRRTEFNVLSGTSMSCPHASGVAALLKGAHPDWSPAMIRSAMMTTAYTQDPDGKPLLDEKSYNISTVWDTGAGHVNPEKAVDPGLVYDISANDYVNFLCASNFTRREIRQIARRPVNCARRPLKPWDLNYPAIVVEFEASQPSDLEIVVTRTATHVQENPATYTASVTNPKGALVTVNPVKMEFTAKGEKQSFMVRIKAEKLAVRPGNNVTEVGKIIWSHGRREVVSPVVVVWKQGF